MVESFLNYIQYEKRYSIHTVKSYKTDLEQFFAYLKINYDTTEIFDVSSEMVRSWFIYLIDNSISARSINRKKTALKTFFKFQQRQGVLKKNPISEVLSLKTSKRLPSFVEKDKLNFLLDSLEDDEKKDFTSLRNRLILELLYSTGIRLSELVNLKDSDIDYYNLTIRVLGKRNKERFIPFNNHLKAIFQNYHHLKLIHYNSVEARIWLFNTGTGKKIYQKLIYRIVIECLSKIITQKKKSPHILRHTFATHILNNGANLDVIKEILGHANLTATQIYTHNSIEKLKLMYKQAHPKA